MKLFLLLLSLGIFFAASSANGTEPHQSSCIRPRHCWGSTEIPMACCDGQKPYYGYAVVGFVQEGNKEITDQDYIDGRLREGCIVMINCGPNDCQKSVENKTSATIYAYILNCSGEGSQDDSILHKFADAARGVVSTTPTVIGGFLK